MSTERISADLETLPDMVARLRQELKAMRSSGTELPAMLVWVKAAADALEARVDPAAHVFTESERAALVAAQGMTYNVAADCWPGWEVASAQDVRPKVSLRDGLDLARRSYALVQRVQLGPVREGTAQWMIGAYQLALDEIDEAIATFSAAIDRYQAGGAPGAAWLTRGYIAIAHERAHRPLPAGVASFEETLNALETGGFQDATEWRAQLNVARRVFT